MAKKSPIKYYVVSDPPKGQQPIIQMVDVSSREAHKMARSLTESERCPHVVLKPLATYTVKINKKRHG